MGTLDGIDGTECRFPDGTDLETVPVFGALCTPKGLTLESNIDRRFNRSKPVVGLRRPIATHIIVTIRTPLDQRTRPCDATLCFSF